MKLKSLSVAFLLAALTSCTSIGFVTYDRLRPAEVSFPNEVRRVGILNAVPLGSEEVDEEGKLSGNGAMAIESLAQNLAETHYFDEIILSDSILRSDATFSAGISPAEKDYFIQSLGVDMLLVMNRIGVRLTKSHIFYPELPQPVPVVCSYVTPELQVYVPERTNPIYTIQKTDSMYWECIGGLDSKSIVQETSDYAGEFITKLIVPYWTQTARCIYDDGHLSLRDGAACVREGGWDDAAALWKELYQNGPEKRKHMAAYNLAVYYEYVGKIEEAKKYLEEALARVKKGSADEVLMRRFKDDFDKEFSSHQRLHLQMNRFENKNE